MLMPMAKKCRYISIADADADVSVDLWFFCDMKYEIKTTMKMGNGFYGFFCNTKYEIKTTMKISRFTVLTTQFLHHAINIQVFMTITILITVFYLIYAVCGSAI